MRVPIVPHSCQHLMLSVFWMLGTGRCVISHCDFSLHFSSDVGCETSFHILIAICIPSLVMCLLRSFAYCSIGLLYCCIIRVLCIFWITILYHI